jgi:branched-chain amino acid transport system permease protein
MDLEIAAILALDGVANGAIYVLAALGIVLIFAVTRVIFVPFGDIAAFTVLSLAAIQAGRLPATGWLVATLAAIAMAMEAWSLLRAGRLERVPRAALLYVVLPLAPALAAWALAGVALPMAAQIALAISLVLPIAPLLNRIAFRPIADAPVLVLLIVAVALHFSLSGMGLIFFGPEGVRTEAFTTEVYTLGGVIVSGQTVIFVVAAIAFSLLLFLFFERTITGKALRATAINRVGARLVGIRPATSGALAFLLASLLGAVSGVLIGPVTTMYYDSGFLIGLKAFVGAIIGGLLSYPGAMAGALFVGLLESYASFWDSALKEVFVFGTLIPILLWRSLMAPTSSDADEEETS